MQTPAAGLTAGRGRQLARLALGVLAFFVVVDAVVLMWPRAGSLYVRYAALLLAVVALAAGVTFVRIIARADGVAGLSLPATEAALSDLLTRLDSYTAHEVAPGPLCGSVTVLVGAGGVFVLGFDHTPGRAHFDGRVLRVGDQHVPGWRATSLARAARALEHRIESARGHHVPVRAIYLFTRARVPAQCRWLGTTAASLVGFNSGGGFGSLVDIASHQVDTWDQMAVRALLAGEAAIRPQRLTVPAGTPPPAVPERGLFEKPSSRQPA